ncbi:ribonuclease H-like domain-containing protein [Tanacetum coccineum]
MWLTAMAAADGGGERQANDGDGICTLGVRKSSYLDQLIVDISHLEVREGPDKCLWSTSNDESFFVGALRRIIDNHLLPSMATKTTWEKTFPYKVNIFMWRLNLDRLPHRFNLSSRGIDIPEISCNGNVESNTHIFFECPLAKEVWNIIRRWCGDSFPFFDSNTHRVEWLASWHGSQSKENRFLVIIAATLWFIWRSSLAASDISLKWQGSWELFNLVLFILVFFFNSIVIMSLHGYFDGEYDDGSDVDNVTLISKLDVSHPLHLHPNDFVALTVVSMKLKGTENYQVWSCAMLLALEGKSKTGFIDGSCRRSNTDEVLGRQWDRVNVVVLGWILNSIYEELFLGQIFSKRAKHVWDELKETYDKVDGSVTFSLHHKFHTLSQNGSSIADYYHKLNALWKQFDALIELPRCTCHAADDFKKHNQLMKLMQFLMGLDDTYMQIRSSILSRETLPDVMSAYAIISSESQTSTSFSRPSNNNRPNDNENRRTDGGSTLVCENYGFNGHTIDKCFKIIGYPADFGKRKAGSNLKGKNISNNVVGSNSSNGFSDKQMATLISLIKENSVNGKGVHSNMAGTYMNSSTVFNKNFEKFFYSNSSLHSKLVSKGLITDSGANQHITYTDKNLIDVIDISYLKIKVTHPNGTEAFIARIGNMPLTDYLLIPMNRS